MRKFHIEPRFQLTSANLRNLFIEALSWFSFLKVSKSCISPSSVWMEGGNEQPESVGSFSPSESSWQMVFSNL